MELVIVQMLVSALLEALAPTIQTGVKSFVETLIAQIPGMASAGNDTVSVFVKGELSRVKTMIAEHRDPTKDEWDELNATVASELSKLNAQVEMPDGA